MSNDAGEAFAKRLLAAVPELTPVYEKHLRDMDGEFLSHPFMGDVTRLVLAKDASLPLATLLAFFESELASGDDHADDLIALSFCENLIGEDQALAALRPLMGPRLSATLKRVTGA